MWRNEKSKVNRIMMNDLVIWVISFVICATMFVVNRYYIMSKLSFTTLREADVKYQKTDPILGTGNGLGISFYKSERCDFKTGATVYYQFITIFLPLIPIGCYLAKEIGYHKENHKKATTSYAIYGVAKWNVWEILSIYLWWYPIFGGIVSIIGIICCL